MSGKALRALQCGQRMIASSQCVVDQRCSAEQVPVSYVCISFYYRYNASCEFHYCSQKHQNLPPSSSFFSPPLPHSEPHLLFCEHTCSHLSRMTSPLSPLSQGPCHLRHKFLVPIEVFQMGLLCYEKPIWKTNHLHWNYLAGTELSFCWPCFSKPSALLPAWLRCASANPLQTLPWGSSSIYEPH